MVATAGTVLASDREIIIDSPWIERDGASDIQ